jgi:hypothetical protein
MRPLEDRLEIKITGEDVDEEWQLKDVAAMLEPYLKQAHRLGEQLLEALLDTQ